jgi:hypothetical protein
MKKLLLLLSLTLCACTTTQRLIPANTPASVGADWTVSSTDTWMQFGFKGEEWWTKDGVFLNQLKFIGEVKPGEHVFKANVASKNKDISPLWRARLNTRETSELLIDAFKAAGFVDVKMLKVAPTRFRGGEGFRLELEMSTSKGLIYRALIVGSSGAEILRYAAYQAPAEFYYERDLAAVESVLIGLR